MFSSAGTCFSYRGNVNIQHFFFKLHHVPLNSVRSQKIISISNLSVSIILNHRDLKVIKINCESQLFI